MCNTVNVLNISEAERVQVGRPREQQVGEAGGQPARRTAHRHPAGGRGRAGAQRRGNYRSLCRLPSWCDVSSDRSFTVDPLSYFSFSQCSTTGVTKAVV